MANYLFVVNKAKKYRPRWAKFSMKEHVKIQNCGKATNSARGVNANKVNKASFNGILNKVHDEF